MKTKELQQLLISKGYLETGEDDAFTIKFNY